MTEGVFMTHKIKQERVVSKNLEFQFEGEIYQIITDKSNKSLTRAHITAIKKLDGSLSFEYQGKPLTVQKYREQPAPLELSSKEINYHLDHRVGHKPSLE